MSVINRIILSDVLKIRERRFPCSGLIPRHLQTKSKAKVTSYALNKYVSFIKSYDISLKKNFPRTMKLYEEFSVGLKFFKNDLVILLRAFKKVTSAGINSLTKKELQVYHEMPKDILRTSPVLFVGLLVPGGTVIFIAAYYFPKQMLTHHFWSLQQRNEFAVVAHRKKLQYYKPVLKYMLKSLSSLQGNSLFRPCHQLLEGLEKGMLPNVDLVLSCRPLFEKSPYGLDYLTRTHVIGLLKLHDMHKGWSRRKRLYERANLIKLMDLAIVREGGVEILTQDEMKWHCFFRGINPLNLNDQQMLVWLRTWLTVSQHVEANCYSLLLHCPVLLACHESGAKSL